MNSAWAKWILMTGLTLMLVPVVAAAAQPSGEHSGQVLLERVQPLAKKGNAKAEYNMGVIYDRGFGVDRDYKKAKSWYEKAAAQDYARAAHNLGVMYKKGHGVTASDKRAAQWFKKAAELGLPAAENNLATMYAQGQGVERSLRLAGIWIARAARGGNKSAIANLPVIAADLPQSKINGQHVNIRGKPSTSADVLTRLDAGTDVAVLAEKKGWTQVLLTSDYVVGWVSTPLLTKHEKPAKKGAEAEPKQAAASATKREMAKTAKQREQKPTQKREAGKLTASSTSASAARKKVGANTVNVRSKPSRQASVVFQLKRGARVTVEKSRNSWAYIKLKDGRHGWVASYLLVGA